MVLFTNRALPLVAAALTLCGVGLAGCAYFRPPVGSSNSGDVRPPKSDANLTDEELSVIEDAEDGDDRTLTRQGRGGYLYTFADELGSRISPGTNSDFTVAPGGVEDTGYALHMAGKLSDKGEDVYAGLGFSLTDPEGPYNATGYCGLEFVARRAAGSTAFVRLKVPDINTTPEGGHCTDCYNDFGVDFEVEEEWVHYVVEFPDLKQEYGWGDPQPAMVSVHALWGIQWQVALRGADFDIWVDDVKFTSCSESRNEVK